MSNSTFQDILPLVEKPSRYLGTEINTIKKDVNAVQLRMLLAFPDLYEIGTSHFGLQILYHILNTHNHIYAERVYTPGTDMEAHLRATGASITSLESGSPAIDFHIIGFSLLYELNYTNILTILDLAGIPFFASQRDNSHPLIIAGGPCTCNPEPLADFFDAFVVGDGEHVIMEIADTWLKLKDDDKIDKTARLKELSKIEGVYIPSLFQAKYTARGFQELVPDFSSHTGVTRTIIDTLSSSHFPDAPILPFGRPVHDRLRLEIARGCTRGCRFCQAGMLYRPVRERSVADLLILAEKSLAKTGYEDISLLSLSTGDYGCLMPLMEHLMGRYASRHVAVSLPSLRAGTLTPNLMELIKKVRKTGFTIAPEAGSQRLRDVINKNITQKDIIDTVSDAFNLGWNLIKLYFMIGLPTETDDDLQEIVHLVKELKKIKSSKKLKKKQINVSITTFIPKPHTPFQWVPQLSLAESKEKIFWLKDRLKIPGVQFKWQTPEASILEGLWSKGDRRLGQLLVAAYTKGCRFDGWTDKFQYPLWEESFSDTGIDVDFFTTRIRDIHEPLPWDHVDIKVSKKFLLEEYEKALNGELTDDCRNNICNSCGVCDLDSLAPKVFDTVDKNIPVPSEKNNFNDGPYKTLRIAYSKRGTAKYFGHLELVNILLRAVKRAGIPVKYSQGFHPKPRISFEDPLPVGIESLKEYLYLTVPVHINPTPIINDLNVHLPEGLSVHECIVSISQPKAKKTSGYIVSLNEGDFDDNALQQFADTSEYMFSKLNKKGKLIKFNLKDIVLYMELISTSSLKMILTSETGRTLRPYDVVTSVFNLSEEILKKSDIIKIPVE